MIVNRLLMAVLLAAPLAVSAAEGTSAESRTVELKDGTRVVVAADGKMQHYDKLGRPLRMRNGTRMEGADGTVYLMHNSVLWQRFWMRGTTREPGIR